MRLSRVTRIIPCCLAVAISIRSTGSFGGLPGSWWDAINIKGDRLVSANLGTSHNSWNHAPRSMAREILPFDCSIAISQAVMSDTRSRQFDCGSFSKLAPGSRSSAPVVSQINEQVSRSSSLGASSVWKGRDLSGAFLDFLLAIAQSSETPQLPLVGAVRSTPGITVIAPFSFANTFRSASCAAETGSSRKSGTAT